MPLSFEPTAIDGVFVIDITPIADDRGFFARSFCRLEFAERGLEPAVEQCNIARTNLAGTVRGLHFQTGTAAEAKLVRCTRGALVDVVVDMRVGSATLGQHLSVELTEDNHRALYIPPFFAQSYQTLVDDTEILYQVSQAFVPGVEQGLRYSDPILGIDWPCPVTVVSDKDQQWPLLDSVDTLREMAEQSAPSA